MKELTKRIATGALLIGIGCTAAIPTHYISYQMGRESAEPIEARVSECINHDGSNWYTYLEGLYIRDASGEVTKLHKQDQNVELNNPHFPEDGSLKTSLYKIDFDN